MKTLVFQSFRTANVLGWMQRCMDSVEEWAKAQGYSYIRLDDSFFEMVPGWFRAKSRLSKLPLTDLARLQWIEKFLSDEWERVIWFDADVLVFNPSSFQIECSSPEIFSREVWIQKKPGKSPSAKKNTNNSVMSFTRESKFLHEYIEGCLRVARDATVALPKNSLGPMFLRSAFGTKQPVTIPGTANFSPAMMREIASEKRECILLHARHWNGKVHAANLCYSISRQGDDLAEERMARAVERLLKTKGRVVNPGWWEISVLQPARETFRNIRGRLSGPETGRDVTRG